MRSRWGRGPVEVVVADPGGEAAIPDEELVRRRQAGDPAAFSMIYRRHAPAVASIARRMLRDRSDVEDVVQETFLIAFEQLERLAEPAALRGWISRIAISRAHRRFRRRHLALIDPRAHVDEQISSDAGPELHAELALLSRALDMPDELRQAWLLRRANGDRLDDIAAACGCSLATVKRRLADADALLARHVQRTERAARDAATGLQPAPIKPAPRIARGSHYFGFRSIRKRAAGIGARGFLKIA